MQQIDDDRLTDDAFFMDVARRAAQRGTCLRKKVGAVIVLWPYRRAAMHCMVSGWNTAAHPSLNCDVVGCDVEHGHCQTTLHAEQYAISRVASYDDVDTNHAKLYTTTFPCYNCTKLAINAGITEIIYEDDYRIDPRVLKLIELFDGKITLRQFKNS